MKPLCIAIAFGLALLPGQGSAQLDKPAAEALIRRVVPAHAAQFIIEEIPSSSDTFEIESRGPRIVLRGNNGISIASALYEYLQTVCHGQVTWNGVNLRLPVNLPPVPHPIQKSSPYTYRYYLNYCTFNYSASWWDWPRWEKEIDWMALHGINLPLAITGEEYVWQEVYRDMGFSDKELNSFFSGPAWFAWFWMGNLDGWGGPLTQHWMDTHRNLQRRIVQRERQLGMKPVLPAFTGHVPASFAKHFPNARLKTTNWKNGFADTYILDAADPLFTVIGKKFLEVQQRLYGTDHFYSADTFNENEPPSDDPGFLAGLSKRVYDAMHAADPSATWVMQGWLFYSDRKFWKPAQIRALLDAVPDDHMLLLDLAAEIQPVWKRTDAFYGKPWVWNMLNNFGGNVNLFGRMDGVAEGPATALNYPFRGKLKGIGLTMEAIEQNPVIYELMTDNTWRSTPIDLRVWLAEYVRNRYGRDDSLLTKAWELLRHTAYNGQLIRDGAESIITGRPTLDSSAVWTQTRLNYPAQDLLPAWDLFIQAAGEGSAREQAAGDSAPTEGFLFDLTDITRQVLANYALPLQRQWVEAFRDKDSIAFLRYSGEFLGLIEDMDRLLRTRPDFLLGRWIAAARACGITPEEKHSYERDAKDLITLWGDANSPLHEYANRQWSGLLDGFYKPRWEQFFRLLQTSLRTHTDPDLAAFQKDIRQWEWKWVNAEGVHPTVPAGDSRVIANALYRKYRQRIGAAYTPRFLN